MASYDFHRIRATLNLLIAKGIITEEEYQEEVMKVRYEEKQSMIIDKYKIPYEEYKNKLKNKKIQKFLEENACKTKGETIIRIVRKFNLSKEEAEEIYKAWKKEYMKFKG